MAITAAFFMSAALLLTADNLPVAVTITQRTPIQTISPTGDITAMSEATVGLKMTLVEVEGTQVMLQDAQGTHYRIALSSTDYTPPISATPVAINNVSQNSPLAVLTTNTVAPPSPSPNSEPINPDKPITAATPISNQSPIPDDPVLTVNIGDRKTANEMSVWPPGGVPDQPLLIAAHGNGGSGPKEIKGWLQFAKTHHFTIVCPSFLSSVNAIHLSEDDPYFSDCIRWIKDNLKYNQDGVFMAGFSGGGFSTWCLATKHPDFVHGIIFQSCNFAGDYYDLSLSQWHEKPIKLIWGSADLPDIPVQNGKAVDKLKSEHCTNYTTEVVPGGHHQEHKGMVVSWMEQQMSAPASN